MLGAQGNRMQASASWCQALWVQRPSGVDTATAASPALESSSHEGTGSIAQLYRFLVFISFSC